jgi:hypothetical protein
MRFPHPVLWSGTGDYLEGTFSSNSWEVSERLDTGELDVNGRLEIIEPSIQKLLANGAARTGILISCLETYFSALIDVPALDVAFRLKAGSVHGRVTLLPVIWATQAVEDLSATSLHEEYSGVKLPASRGAILAIADETVISVGREKFAPLETIFELAKRDDLPPGQFSVTLDGDKIGIVACTSTFDQIHQMRASRAMRAVLLSSVYLPVVMAVLAALAGGDRAQFGDRRWFRIFSARAEYLSINIDSCDVLEAAQTILSLPFSRLATEFTARLG